MTTDSWNNMSCDFLVQQTGCNNILIVIKDAMIKSVMIQKTEDIRQSLTTKFIHKVISLVYRFYN